MNKQQLYDKLLKRLDEIREYEWSAYDLKFWGESYDEDGTVLIKGSDGHK